MKQFKRSFLAMLTLLVLMFGTLGVFSSVNASSASSADMGRREGGLNRYLFLAHDLDWNTFIGHDNPQTGPVIAVDGAGNVFATGKTGVDGTDAYIARLNPVTGSVVWNTVLTDSKGSSIAVDEGGNVFVTGWSSTTWGSPIQPFLSGGANAFVVKINPLTGSIVWNTFLNTFRVAPEVSDESLSIAVDASNNIFVVGTSDAAWGDSPVRPYDAGLDSFVVELNALTGSLTWITFLGGSGHDNGLSVAADGSGNIFVTGRSDATWGSPLSTYDAGFDIFVAKLNASTGSLTWHTFLSYGSFDYGFSIAVNSSGDVFIAGYGGSTLVAKFNPSTGNLIWDTLLGSTGIDTGYGIAVDNSSGNIVVVGQSGASWGSPIRLYTPPNEPFSDGFVAGLNPDTGSVIWNTFLGGGGSDAAYSVAVDGSGNVFISGGSDATWGSPVGAFTGYPDADGFIAKLSNDAVDKTVTATATDIATNTSTFTPTFTNTVPVTTTPTATLTITPTTTVSATPTITKTFTRTPTPTKTPITLTIPSLGSCDGWVLKLSPSSTVGALNSTATILRLGDDALHKQYRSVLCFQTSIIPDTATITSVVLRVKKQSVVGGGDPVVMLKGFRADIKTGYFGSSVALQLPDFGASPSGSFGPFIIGGLPSFYNINLTAGASLINKFSGGAGQTQIRLRFTTPSNMNSVANILLLFSGNAGVADRPQLIVSYY